MSARLAILGLLVEQPRHGYAIDRLIEERGMRRWAGIGFSSIYWVLDRLVADGLAEVQEVQTDGRAGGRKIFRATKAGVQVWRNESLAALADFDRPLEDFLIALSWLPGLDQAHARAALERRLAAIDTRREAMFRDRERAGPDMPGHVDEMFALGRAILEAQHTWLVGFLTDRWPTRTQLPAADRSNQHKQEASS